MDKEGAPPNGLSHAGGGGSKQEVGQCDLLSVDGVVARLAGRDLVGFLQEMVPVYEQVVVRTCEAGVVVQYDRAEDMTRVAFYTAFLRDFAFRVCRCKLALVSTTEAIKATSRLSSMQALDMYTGFVNTLSVDGNGPGVKIGLCSRDSVMTESTAKLIERVGKGWGADCLDALGEYEGMSQRRAYAHSGGIVLMGTQLEEGFLHTWDAMMDLWIPGQEGHPGIHDIQMHALREVHRLSAKRWLVHKRRCTVSNILNLSQLICDEFKEPFAGWEHVIQSKAFVLNPTFWTSKYADLFDIIIQTPGTAICTQSARSCVGNSALSISWCKCEPSLLHQYTDLELSLSSNAQPQAPERGVACRGLDVSFSLTCELLQAYDREYQANPASTFVKDVMPLAQHIFAECMEASQAKGALKVCRTSKYLNAYTCDRYTQKGQTLVCASCGYPLPFVAVSKTVDHKQQLFCGRCTTALWPSKRSRVGCSIIFVRSHLVVGLHEYLK